MVLGIFSTIGRMVHKAANGFGEIIRAGSSRLREGIKRFQAGISGKEYKPPEPKIVDLNKSLFSGMKIETPGAKKLANDIKTMAGSVHFNVDELKDAAKVIKKLDAKLKEFGKNPEIADYWIKNAKQLTMFGKMEYGKVSDPEIFDMFPDWLDEWESIIAGLENAWYIMEDLREFEICYYLQDLIDDIRKMQVQHIPIPDEIKEQIEELIDMLTVSSNEPFVVDRLEVEELINEIRDMIADAISDYLENEDSD